MSSTTLLIVRHGQTDWNVQKRIQGHTDIPLNDTGKSEALTLAEKLQTTRFVACYSSDLSRAFETATILARPHALPVQSDTRLRERQFGPWEGRLRDDLFACPLPERGGVENSQDLHQRVFHCFDELAMQHAGESVLIVSHGGLMLSILLQIGGFECPIELLKSRNTATIQLEHSGGRWSLKDVQGITFATGEPFTLDS